MDQLPGALPDVVRRHSAFAHSTVESFSKLDQLHAQQISIYKAHSVCTDLNTKVCDAKTAAFS